MIYINREKCCIRFVQLQQVKNLRIAMEYANVKGDLVLLKLVVDQEKVHLLQ